MGSSGVALASHYLLTLVGVAVAAVAVAEKSIIILLDLGQRYQQRQSPDHNANDGAADGAPCFARASSSCRRLGGRRRHHHYHQRRQSRS